MDGKALLTWNRMIFTIIKTPGQLHIVLSDYYDNIVMITLAIYIFFHLIMHKYVHFLMSKKTPVSITVIRKIRELLMNGKMQFVLFTCTICKTSQL